MGKGWPYQALPFLLPALLAFLWQLTRAAKASRTALLSLGGLLLGVVVIAFLVRVNNPFVLAERRVELERAAAAVRRVAERPTIATIAARLQPAHPLTRMIGGDYRSRYPSLWMVENAGRLIGARGADPGQVRRLRAWQEEIIAVSASDIARETPDIILDAGAEGSAGQAEIHSNAAIARLLESYRTLYRDRVTTVLVRSELGSIMVDPADAGSR
jgi:hypothetical protein